MHANSQHAWLHVGWQDYLARALRVEQVSCVAERTCSSHMIQAHLSGPCMHIWSAQLCRHAWLHSYVHLRAPALQPAAVVAAAHLVRSAWSRDAMHNAAKLSKIAAIGPLHTFGNATGCMHRVQAE